LGNEIDYFREKIPLTAMRDLHFIVTQPTADIP